MRVVIAGLMLLLAAAPAAEPMSAKGKCRSRCQVQYQACLKRTTTQKGRAQCKVERKTCKGTCR
jgi:hypothetical protein